MINIDKIPLEGTETEYYNEGDVIIRDGEFGDNMYILTAGKADIFKNYGELGEVKVASLSSGDFFGEMSLFLNRERTATVVAAEYMSVFVLNHANALDFFQSQPEATFSLIQALCSRLVNTNVSMSDNSIKYEKNIIVLNNEKSELKVAANVDPLTGAYNRRYFSEAAGELVAEAFKQKKTAYVALIDLDFFKKVNDTYGHQAGDEVLKTAAATVAESIRAYDLFARYGGEEFILLFANTNRATVEKLVERIRANIEGKVIEFESHVIRVTASMGIAEVTEDVGFEKSVAFADEALYKAKENGRNQCVFN